MTPGNALPEGWSTVRFGDVVRDVREAESDPLETGLERYVGLEHIEPENLHIKEWGLVAEGTSFTRRFKKGQVLFAKRRAYQRKVAMAESDGVCSGDILVFEPKDDRLLPELLPFIVQSEAFFANALRTSSGSLSPRTRWRDLAAYEFALPPLDEQRRIAGILWAADESVEQTRSCVVAQSSLKRTLARELFSFADGVRTVPLGDIGTWLSGGTPSRSRKDFWEGSIPWASPKDMKSDILQDTLESVSQEGVASGSRLTPKDSILIVVRGMILAHSLPIAMTGRPMAFNQDMKALAISEKFNARYVFYWLQRHTSKILRLVSDSSHGTKRIPTELLFRMRVPHPSIRRQNEIVAVLEECDKAENQMQDHIDQVSELRERLLLTLLGK